MTHNYRTHNLVRFCLSRSGNSDERYSVSERSRFFCFIISVICMFLPHFLCRISRKGEAEKIKLKRVNKNIMQIVHCFRLSPVRSAFSRIDIRKFDVLLFYTKIQFSLLHFFSYFAFPLLFAPLSLAFRFDIFSPQSTRGRAGTQREGKRIRLQSVGSGAARDRRRCLCRSMCELYPRMSMWKNEFPKRKKQLGECLRQLFTEVSELSDGAMMMMTTTETL